MVFGDDVSSRVTIICYKRIAPKYRNKLPGLVKESFQTLVFQKILVLKNKMKLRNIDEYNRVFFIDWMT